ncbi:DUF3152 domain-containing protein [Micromonospora andamanensis]|uniref:Lipoprotein n=1 Tax=Micromonospora andamanensis TaxID=1287068 RepID=A0ABQ4HZ91_9ACTN|nr:DUF3152 domain-containing protein [Micromonospora andamanensis]GIJ10936.1 lipoprotein [Micromonospora andamanensis]
MSRNPTRARAGGWRARPLAAVLLTGLFAGCAPPATAESNPPSAGATRSGSVASTPAGPVRSSPVAPPPVSYPADGGGRWAVADGEPPTAAGPGRLLRYRVAVERDIRGLPVADFAAEVTRTLADPQGWTAGGAWRLRRVGPRQPADFTVYLATPGTRDVLCQDTPDGYTSCRNGDRVVINVARWVKGVPDYGASLAVYRRYVINHEVGHRLGLGHERCPGRGRPAPVMQQQTLGLHGCTANAMPYLDGRRHSGPPGSYADPIPPRERGRPG